MLEGNLGTGGCAGDTVRQSRTTDAGGHPIPEVVRPDKFELELITAFQRELNNCHSRIYDLERKIARYDRAFETMFKEELDSRINGKGTTVREYANACSEPNGLEQLKWQAEKMAKAGRL